MKFLAIAALLCLLAMPISAYAAFSFFHGHGYIEEAGFVQDDSQNGAATYLDKPRGVEVVWNYMYALSLEENAFCIFDVSNPADITEVSCVVDGDGATMIERAKDVSVQRRYAYVVSNGDDALSIFDVSDKSNIVEVGYIQDDSHGGDATGLDGASSIIVSGRYAYVTSYDEQALAIFDVSDKTAPVEISVVRNGDQGSELTGCSNAFKLGNYLYVVSKYTSDSLSIFDVSDPYNPVLTDYVRDGSGATELDGPSAVYVSRGHAFVTARDSDSLSIFDVSDPYDIQEVTTLVDGVDSDYLGSARGLMLKRGYAYVSSGDDDAVVIFDVSDVNNPYEVGHIQDESLGGEATALKTPLVDMDLAGNYLYVAANGDDAISVFAL